MKKLYEELEMEVIRFEAEDVITASVCGDNNPNTETADGTPTYEVN